VNDNTNPTITAPSNVTVNANASCSAFNVNIGSPTTSDNCTVVSVTNNAPVVFPLGTTTVTWTVADAAGNISTATQTITVVDLVAPVIFAPTNITVPVSSNCSAIVASLGTPVVFDNCDIPSISNNAPATFPVGTTTVIWTVTDAAGNISTASQQVTVTDLVAPVITSPTDITVSANSGCSATGVVLGNPVVTDDCAILSLINNAPAIFPLGTTTVTWTATDINGNSAQSIQLVTVNDNINPVIFAPADVVIDANAACEATLVALGSPVTSDNCSILSVTNNAPSAFQIGVTNIIWTVSDAAGNTATATQTVTVEDNTNPSVIAPADVFVYVSSSCEVSNVSLGQPYTTDNCSVATITSDAPATYQIGITTITWTATDASGNTSTATQLVTVADTVSPVVLTNDLTVTLSPSGSVSITPADADAGSTDNCSIADITLSQEIFTCEHLGMNKVELIVEDVYGNISVVQFNVTVLQSGVDADFDGIDDACDNLVNTTEVLIPNGFTPDGDGINDFFVIPGLSSSTLKTLHIFNRYGNKVYESNEYANQWDGTSSQNGAALPDDTYYYVLMLDNGVEKQGFVYINRAK
jgi:gliding motility-associated-like protein